MFVKHIVEIVYHKKYIIYCKK